MFDPEEYQTDILHLYAECLKRWRRWTCMEPLRGNQERFIFM